LLSVNGIKIATLSYARIGNKCSLWLLPQFYCSTLLCSAPQENCCWKSNFRHTHTFTCAYMHMHRHTHTHTHTHTRFPLLFSLIPCRSNLFWKGGRGN
jgi:hypothetical protein